MWTHAGAAGRRVAAFDVPWAGPTNGGQAVHLWGWGTHDKPFGIGSDPPEALELLRRRHGEHAVAHDHATRSHCDNHEDSHESYSDLLSRLLRGIELKTELALDLLAQKEWDLYFTAFSESHCVGHHFWHFLDPSSRWHDTSAPGELKGAIRSVYTALDGALARLLARAGNGATTVVFMPLGMGPMPGGWQLLPECSCASAMGRDMGKRAPCGNGSRSRSSAFFEPRSAGEPVPAYGKRPDLSRFLSSRRPRAPLPFRTSQPARSA